MQSASIFAAASAGRAVQLGFVDKLQLADRIGLNAVFQDFNLTQLHSSQIINSRFDNISIDMRVRAVLSVRMESYILIRNTQVHNVHCRFINGIRAYIDIYNMTVQDYALDILKHVHSNMSNTQDLDHGYKFDRLIDFLITESLSMQDLKEKESYYANLRDQITDVFILLNQGSVTIDSSNFDHLLTLRALFWFSDLCIVDIRNSNFEKVVSLLQVSMIFSI